MRGQGTSRRIWWRFASPVVVVAGCLRVSASSVDASSATCRGHRATIVGTPRRDTLPEVRPATT